MAVESHRGEATTGRGMQVGSGRGEADFGAVVICGCFHGPSSPEHFYQRHSGQHLSCELVTAISPAFQGCSGCPQSRPCPHVPLQPRASQSGAAIPTRPRYPPQALKIEAGALTHTSHPPFKPAAENGAGSPVSPSVPCRPCLPCRLPAPVPPLDGHTGPAAAPPANLPA